MRAYPLIAALGLAALAAQPVLAQEKPPAVEAPAKGSEKAAKADAPDLAQASAEEDAQPRRGSVTVGGKVIGYTVTPGTVVIRNDDGEAVASMFYVAYVADRPKGSAPRPVTFTYNGGPGSSSMWLHMGSIGPVHVETPLVEVAAPAPYKITENHETMLDKTDIVFIDAIGTGLSRPIGKSKGPEFYGVDQDIDAFARGIMRYLTINDRWDSPKFLFGESYGTLRSAGLVHALQERGVQMNGVILLSSILNYGVRQPGFDQIFVTYLPSYAATAWYHNRLQNRPAALEPFLMKWVPVPVLRLKSERGPAGEERYDAGPSSWARLRVVELDMPDPDTGHTHRVQLRTYQISMRYAKELNLLQAILI